MVDERSLDAPVLLRDLLLLMGRGQHASGAQRILVDTDDAPGGGRSFGAVVTASRRTGSHDGAIGLSGFFRQQRLGPGRTLALQTLQRILNDAHAISPCRNCEVKSSVSNTSSARATSAAAPNEYAQMARRLAALCRSGQVMLTLPSTGNWVISVS